MTACDPFVRRQHDVPHLVVLLEHADRALEGLARTGRQRSQKINWSAITPHVINVTDCVPVFPEGRGLFPCMCIPDPNGGINGTPGAG